jgi:dTDP-4-dehydrorhamnose reductase
VKVFITGADGALGTAIQTVLRRENITFRATDIKQLDIADYSAAHTALSNYRPDIILHGAAISSVDTCEQNPELAHRVNALGTMGLATIARKIHAKMLYVSTNYVFDGAEEKSYYEYSQTHPLNEYGRTKLLGEQYVKDICDRYMIVRTSWLFGHNAKNFVPSFIVSASKSTSIDVICDLFGSFTYTVDLAEALFLLIKADAYGMFHIVNTGVGSWLDFALKAKEIMRIKTDIKSVETEELHLAAPRPRYAPLESTNYEYLTGKTMPAWERSLATYIKTLPKK